MKVTIEFEHADSGDYYACSCDWWVAKVYRNRGQFLIYLKDKAPEHFENYLISIGGGMKQNPLAVIPRDTLMCIVEYTKMF